MRIRWTPAAAADLQSVSEYLREHNPQYRRPTMRKLYEGVRSMKGRIVAVQGGRMERGNFYFIPCPIFPCTE